VNSSAGTTAPRAPAIEVTGSQAEPSPGPAGRGLGLFLVREIAELHGRRATAVGEGEGRGATFTVAIPALAPASPR
jgi:signal transduction histidine kinase